MPFICGDREQIQFLPPSIEEFVATDDPVRAYDAFVEALNLIELKISEDPGQVGHPEFEPRAMLKLLVYGYAYGLRSSRKLERACHHNLSFLWLMGGLRPDHKTIARFRRTHREPLRKVLRQCARMCLQLGLIEGNTLFVDGTKVRGNASLKAQWSEKRCREALAAADGRIASILSEAEAVDQAEEGQDSLVHLRDDLKDAQARKREVAEVMKRLAEEDRSSLNTTDPDALIQKKRGQSAVAGYNLQAVTDAQQGLIVQTDVVQDANDSRQFREQLEQAQQTLEKSCTVACADAGYANTAEMKQVEEQGIQVIVPPARDTSVTANGPFAKEHFFYVADHDFYYCPEGKVLRYRKTDSKGGRYYQTSPGVCQACPCVGWCTRSTQGRSVLRLKDEEVRQRLAARYREPSSQAIYRERAYRSEPPFGHIKRNLGVQAFLLRGLAGVRAEASLLATAFNLARMVRLLGVHGLIHKLAPVL